MKCPNCKKKIEKGKKFCGYCGAAIPEKAKRKVDKRILIPAGVAGVCGVALLGTVILTNPQQTSASKLEKKLRQETGICSLLIMKRQKLRLMKL